MSKILLLVIGLTILASVFIATREYRELTGITCYSGEFIDNHTPVDDETDRVHWFWQWWPNRDEDKAFIQCVGSGSYIVYRPLDIAGVGFVLSGGLLIIALRPRNRSKS